MENLPYKCGGFKNRTVTNGNDICWTSRKYVHTTKPLVIIHILTNKNHNLTNSGAINGNEISTYNQAYDSHLYFYSYGPVSMFPQRDCSWVVEFQSQNRGHIDTIICPSNVFIALLYIPYLWFFPISAYRYKYSPLLHPSPSPSATSAALDPANSSPYY